MIKTGEKDVGLDRVEQMQHWMVEVKLFLFLFLKFFWVVEVKLNWLTFVLLVDLIRPFYDLVVTRPAVV